MKNGCCEHGLPARGKWLVREAEGACSGSERRILLLTATYPPRTEVGAARWEGFTPYLIADGWGLDVVLERPAVADPLDWQRVRALPGDVRIGVSDLRQPWWHRTLLGTRDKLKRRVSRTQRPASTGTNYVAAVPGARARLRAVVDDAVLGWQARRGAADLYHVASSLSDARARVIITSGPPHYVHAAGSRLAREHDLKHVVDLRDPWGPCGPRSAAQWLFGDARLCGFEATTLISAALIITNTPAAERVLANRFPHISARVRCIPNGSDLEPKQRGAPPVPACFTIAHCGSLYLDRDPRPFFRAVGRVYRRLALTPADLHVTFMGPPVNIGGQSLMDAASAAGIGDAFEARGPGTRDEARSLLQLSMMAVAFQGETRTQIPAKVFEYVAFPVWLLALAGRDSATAELLASSDAIVLDIDDEAGIERAVEGAYLKFRAGVTPRPVGHDGRFSRASQAKRLTAELDALEHAGDAVHR